MNTTTPPPDGWIFPEDIEILRKSRHRLKDVPVYTYNTPGAIPVWFLTVPPMGEEEVRERATAAANKLQPSGEGGFHPDPLWHEAYDIYMQAWRDITGKGE